MINTYAGGGPNNVPATSANVAYPVAIATDSSGNYYFGTAVAAEVRVFRVSSSGTLTVFAGNGFEGYGGDGGPAAQGELSYPAGIAADSLGNVYIADEAICIIRKVDTTGTISTFAGTLGNCSYGGDGGPATSAYLNKPHGVAVDSSGNIYIADTDNYRIREVTVSNGEINTVAGNGTECTGGGAACGDGGPATSAGISYVYSLAVDSSGNVHIADSDNYSIRKFSVGGNISTVAGNGTEGYSGDGGAATSAELSAVVGVAVDSPGNMFIADTANYRIREVTASNGKINTVAGNGTNCSNGGAACGDGGLATNAGLSRVYGVAVDSSDDIFIPDYFNLAIREVTAANGKINTVAGNGTPQFAGNGVPATDAALNEPAGATSDSAGNIYIADQLNWIVRQVSATTGNITTFAGTPGVQGYSGDGGPATSALLNYPTKVAVHAGKAYIAEYGNCAIRMVDTSGDISTFAGRPGNCGYGGDGGPATSAQLSSPAGVAVDSSRNVYIADTGSNRVRKVSGGIIRTVAGGGPYGFLGDGGAATSAGLNGPADIAVDASGNLYIADTYNMRIRKVNTAGIISTFAGNGSPGFSGDGIPANQARLYYPWGVAVDAAGDVLIGDTYNNRIRWVDGQGIIHTVAGNGAYSFCGDGGAATSACLANPSGVEVDPSGNISVADTSNSRVRMVSAVAGLNASTTSVTFGSQAVGTTSSPKTVTLSAVGPLDISSIVVTGDFSESGDCATGAMSGQCVMNIAFTPTQTATRSGTVTLSDNGYFSSSLVINLQGTGALPTLTPASASFGNVAIKTASSPKSFTLKNTESAPLNISSITLSNPDFAESSTTCGSSLAAGKLCTISVTFTPSELAAESATLTVNYGPSPPYSTLTSSLSGTGVADVTLTPASHSFGDVALNTPSSAQTFTLRNNELATLSISGITVTSSNASDFAQTGGTCGASLAGLTSCTIIVTLTPTLLGVAETGSLAVTDNAAAPYNSLSATLSGTGIADVTLTPASHNFGNVAINTPSSAQTFTLRNNELATLSISGISVTNSHAGDFAQTGGTCGASLAGQSSCTIIVTLTPTMLGGEAGSLAVTDNAAVAQYQTLTSSLTGTGVAQATVSPTSLTFPKQTVGTTSGAKTVTLRNNLLTTLTVSSLTFTGADPNDFFQTSTCDGSVGAQSTCTISVTFKPTAKGARTATLNVNDSANNSPQTVSLTGTGE